MKAVTPVPSWVPGGSRRHLGDVAIALAATAALMVRVAVAGEPSTRTPDATAFALAALIGGVLVVRRRRPLLVFGISIGAVVVYHALDYPAIGVAVPLAVALSTLSASGFMTGAVVASTTLLLGAAAWRLLVENTQSLLTVVSDVVQEALFMAVVVLLGEALRTRRALAAALQERLRSAAAEREQEAQRRVAEERLRIARDLHDVIAHTITLIGVQAKVAIEVLDDDPADALDPLLAIKAAVQEAMFELHATLALLREGSGDAPRQPLAGLRQLDRLVETMARSGLSVDLSVAGDVRPLPSAINLAAYRVVQESLTNVLRHAQADQVRLEIRYEPDAVVILVENPGGLAAPHPSGDAHGHGIRGMAERAAALGGRLRAGPVPEGGFRVEAQLPLPELVP